MNALTTFLGLDLRSTTTTTTNPLEGFERSLRLGGFRETVDN